MNVKGVLTATGFLLIIIGTVCILLNKFFWGYSSLNTIIFSIVNLVGLINLSIVHYVLKK